MKSIFKTFGAALMGGAIAMGSYTLYQEESPSASNIEIAATPTLATTPVTYNPNGLVGTNLDFTEAAEKTVHAVVHVKNQTIARGNPTIQDIMRGQVPMRQAVGTGSGVIITKDGYIVTNNHVIDNSQALEVTLNDNRTYKAEVVGTEPGSDIALIKIEVNEDLPVVAFGDSDQAKIGEWVLAVGNPFNLTSTVTAGIISAKGRDLNMGDQMQQNFIQTDAAVNPGNSGGALVNQRGELIGINSAIQSPTGSYTGYSFAVPSNNARKIIQDLMEFGSVQKGMIGISGGTLNGRAAAELGLESAEGIYVSDVVEGSGADDAGLKKGDIITNIDGIKMKTFTDLIGYVNSKNPGDRVETEVLRDNKYRKVSIELTKNSTVTIPALDMDLRDLSKAERKQFDIENGALIVGTRNSLSDTDLRGYVIVKVNNDLVNNVNELKSIMNRAAKNQRLILEVKNPNGETERWRMTVD